MSRPTNRCSAPRAWWAFLRISQRSLALKERSRGSRLKTSLGSEKPKENGGDGSRGPKAYIYRCQWLPMIMKTNQITGIFWRFCRTQEDESNSNPFVNPVRTQPIVNSKPHSLAPTQPSLAVWHIGGVNLSDVLLANHHHPPASPKVGFGAKKTKHIKSEFVGHTPSLPSKRSQHIEATELYPLCGTWCLELSKDLTATSWESLRRAGAFPENCCGQLVSTKGVIHT